MSENLYRQWWDQAKARIRELEAENAALVASRDGIAATMLRMHRERDEAREKLATALGSAEPWMTMHLLDKLAEAADHLLSDHDCDCHGHERIKEAGAEARNRSAAIRARLAAPEPVAKETKGAEG